MMDRRRMLLIAIAVLCVVAIGDVYFNGVGMFEHFAAGFTFTMESEHPTATVERTATVDATQLNKLMMQAKGGLIQVSGADSDTDSIVIRAVIHVFSRNTDTVDETVLSGLQLKPRVDGDTLIPELTEGRLSGIDRVQVAWHITVPKRLAVDVTNGFGSVDVRNIDGPVNVSATGSLDVININGPLNVTSQGGALKVRGVAAAVIESNFGSALIADVRGNVDLRTSTSAVTIGGVLGNVVAEGRMGAIDINQVSGAVRVKQEMGAVAIRDVIGEIVVDVTAGEAVIQPQAVAPITATVSAGDLTLLIPRTLVRGYDFQLAANPGEILQNTELAALIQQYAGEPDREVAKATVSRGTLNVRLVD